MIKMSPIFRAGHFLKVRLVPHKKVLLARRGLQGQGIAGQGWLPGKLRLLEERFECMTGAAVIAAISVMKGEMRLLRRYLRRRFTVPEYLIS